MIRFNINYEVTIYPSEQGWVKIKQILQEKYAFKTKEELDKWIANRTVVNDGYKEQLWTIMGDFGDMFFNGSFYLKNTFMDLSGDLVFQEKI